MTTNQSDAVREWLIEEFSGLEAEVPRIDALNVVKFKVGDYRGSRYWLAVSDEFFTSYQSREEIRGQLTTRGVGRDLRTHERQWRLLPRVGPLQAWSPVE